MFGALAADLTRENRTWLRDLLIFSVLFFVLSAASYVLTLKGGAGIPRDSTLMNVGRDYLNFWMYGYAAQTPDPGRFYDYSFYNQELGRMFGLGDLGVNWSYPPTIMLLAAPFAQFTYLNSLLIWTILTFTVFVCAAKQNVPDPRILIPLVFSPAAAACLMHGQSSFVTAALLIGIFAWLDRRPVAAGILIGLLTLKPHLGVLLPVMLIASGRWRVFAAATAAALALAALSVLVFGFQPWIDFVVKGMPTQNTILTDPVMRVATIMPTIFMNLRQIGAEYALAMGVQACAGALAAAAVFWAYRYRRDSDPQMLTALLLACTVAGTPYILSYDLLPLTFAAVMLVATGQLDATGRRLAQLIFWLPVLQIGFGALHIPGPALIPAVFAGYLVMRLKSPAGLTQAASSPAPGGLALRA